MHVWLISQKGKTKGSYTSRLNEHGDKKRLRFLPERRDKKERKKEKKKKKSSLSVGRSLYGQKCH